MTYRSPDQRGTTPQNKGRFAGFDVLSQAHVWDDETAGVVLARLAPPNQLGFFTLAEQATAEPLLDLLLAQDGDPKVPLLALVDTRLAIGETDGWHYDDLPQDDEAWRQTVAFLNEDAQSAHGTTFGELAVTQQGPLVQHVQDLSSKEESWHGFPAKQVWSLWTRYACTAFYSHPWAWNEIGFPGPAYPRGYLNPGVNARERWEVSEDTDIDPIPFVKRTERARRAHDQLTGGSHD